MTAAGIGKATAERFVADGVTVVICDVDVTIGAQTASALGGGCEFCKADFDLVVSVNLKGVFNCTQALNPVMSRVGAFPGLRPFPVNNRPKLQYGLTVSPSIAAPHSGNGWSFSPVSRVCATVHQANAKVHLCNLFPGKA